VRAPCELAHSSRKTFYRKSHFASGFLLCMLRWFCLSLFC
jgi:hypothetical protein